MTTAKCLFGGALFAAGLASHAQAQEFTFELREGGAYTTSDAYVYASLAGAASSDYFMSYNPGAAMYTLGALRGASIATSQLSAGAMSTYAAAATDGGSYAQARGFAYVSFDAGELLHIVWDFTNESPDFRPFFSDISVINMTTFTEEFGLDIANDPSDYFGDVMFAPTPGHKYSIRMASLAGTGGSSLAGISVVLVPAPGVLGIASAAGLVALRRRR